MNIQKQKSQSTQELLRLKTVVPGGIDANAKYFAEMPMAKRAYGCRILDIDDNEYIDYCCGYGPLIFGHDDPELIEALSENLKRGGMLYGLPHVEMEEPASLVSRCVKCAEMVRFTNSGTEATLSCIRLARAVTNRNKIVKFYGAYHGTHESVLIGTRATETEPKYPHVGVNSAGIPKGVIQDTFVLPFNDASFAEKFINQHAEEIAAVLVEPVLGSYGIVADRHFLETVRSVTARNEIILIFDEVVTGFRLALGGAQEVFGIVSDLVALGKAMSGGFPIGAFAGLRKYMEKVAPTGNLAFDNSNVVYHSGTYNSNPMAMVAVKTAINRLIKDNIHHVIDARGKAIRDALRSLMERYGIEGTTAGIGSIVQWYFGITGDITRPEEVVKSDKGLQNRFHSLLLREGVFFIPGPRGYISAAHREVDIDRTIEAIERVFRSL